MENTNIKEVEVVDVEVQEETIDKEYVIDKDGTLVPKWLWIRSQQQAG